MSVDATRWAWRVEVSSSTKRLVLLALADRAGEEHTCYPSAMRMVRDTKLDRKTILKAINDMIDEGLILDTGERKGNGVRVLKLLGVLARENEIHPKKLTDPKIGTSTENGITTDPKIGITTDPKIGITTDPKNGIQNLKGNLKKNLTKQPIFSKALKDKGVDEKLINDWVDIRHKKKAIDSERALSMFFTQVEKSNCDLNTVLNICVIKGWKGFEASYLNNINISDYSFESKCEIIPEQQNKPVRKAVAVKKNYLDVEL